MLTVSNEIERLRLLLESKLIPQYIIQNVCIEAEVRIKDDIQVALEHAISLAKEAGEKANSISFLKEIRALRIGDYFNIATDSGNTDFSTPPFPMLPRLLKTAKVAKDGSRYKVIPIGSKGNTKVPRDNRQTIHLDKPAYGTTFRTVSSKQDMNTKWVYPGKKADMTDTLVNINNDLHLKIDDIIHGIIDQYERIV